MELKPRQQDSGGKWASSASYLCCITQTQSTVKVPRVCNMINITVAAPGWLLGPESVP